MGCSGSQPVAQPTPQKPSAPQPQQHAAVRKGCGKGGGRGRERNLKQMMKSKFQVELEGQFKDYREEEDSILKRAFLVGQPNAKFHLRGQDYEYSFKSMMQNNLTSGRERKIRPPRGMFAPNRAVLPPGLMTVITVPEAGLKELVIEDPQNPGQKITVVLPKNARKGMQIALPLPSKGEKVEAVAKRQAEWSTGAKVAVAGAVAGGLAVGGVALGEHLSGGAISEAAAASPELAAAGGWVEDAAGAVAGVVAPAAAEAGAWVEGAAGDAATWAEGAAADLGEATADSLPDDVADDITDWLGGGFADAGSFVMDLF